MRVLAQANVTTLNCPGNILLTLSRTPALFARCGSERYFRSNSTRRPPLTLQDCDYGFRCAPLGALAWNVVISESFSASVKNLPYSSSR